VTTAAAEKLSEAFQTRAARAELLAPGSSSAEGPLRFAAALYRAQGRCAGAFAALPLTGHLRDDAPRLFAAWDPLLAAIEKHGPPALSAEARFRATQGREALLAQVDGYWKAETFDFVARALLRPYAAALDALGIPPDRVAAVPRERGVLCPFCAGQPVVSARRTPPESHGAARSLVCALCGRETPFARIRCPACEEADPHKLPSFQGEDNAAARIEACETCKRYVKSIDLTLDARPIPEVDDLLTIALDLWAVEQGYERVEPGLAGL
jgi:FdhE protein